MIKLVVVWIVQVLVVTTILWAALNTLEWLWEYF